MLSLSGHRVLARLEVELGHHGGADNGRLPVTYADFQSYGVERKSIPPALREVEALGFARVTERGRPSKSDFGRHPNFFELTYIHGAHGEAPTDEWRRHNTLPEAIKVAQHGTVRQGQECRRQVQGERGPKIRYPGGEIPEYRSGIRPCRPSPLSPGIPPTVQGPKNGLTFYISGWSEAA